MKGCRRMVEFDDWVAVNKVSLRVRRGLAPAGPWPGWVFASGDFTYRGGLVEYAKIAPADPSVHICVFCFQNMARDRWWKRMYTFAVKFPADGFAYHSNHARMRDALKVLRTFMAVRPEAIPVKIAMMEVP